jgi:hypothetical protein
MPTFNFNFNSSNGKCYGIAYENNGVVTIVGKCWTSANTLLYVAAAPPECSYSYMGSGLPFPSAEIAYQSTENQGLAYLKDDGKFQFTLRQPNSYYVDCGSKLIRPHVHLYIGSEIFNIQLGNGIPLRSLSNLPGMPNRSSPSNK